MAKRSALEEPRELTDFSASRLQLAGKCGTAFEYRYVRQLPAPYSSASAILGSVVHEGVEEWYGPPGSSVHQERDLAPIVSARWQQHLPPEIWRRVLELVELRQECEAVQSFITLMRPKIKSPTQTQQYLTAQPVRDFNDKRASMVELCDKLEQIKWRKDEDPWKQYELADRWARRMQERWQLHRRPLVVEYPFRIEFDGFSVRGRIDAVVAAPKSGDVEGEVVIRVRDIKTGSQTMTPMEAFLQSFIYNKAVEVADELPNPDEVEFYLTRHDYYQRGQIDPARHDQLASRILNGRARQIAMGQFEPSYGFWCKQCDFRDLCATEISLWQGDGIVLEVAEARP